MLDLISHVSGGPVVELHIFTTCTRIAKRDVEQAEDALL
jgi:hypothetical protein